MTIKFECENCGKQMQVQDRLAGKTGKCPACGESVTVPAAADDDFLSEDFSLYDQPGGAGTTLNKPCPMCGEMIPKNASSCPACGERLDAPKKKKSSGRARSQEVSQESRIALQIFITGLLGCFSPFVAIYGLVFLIQNQHDFPRKTLAIIGTVLHFIWTGILVLRITSGNF